MNIMTLYGTIGRVWILKIMENNFFNKRKKKNRECFVADYINKMIVYNNENSH